jgi:uncharacterized membrane protein YhaH (DUF805 family)
LNNPYSASSVAMTDMSGDDTYEPSLFSFSGRIGRVRYLAYTMSFFLIVSLAMGVLVAILTAANPAYRAVAAYLPLLSYIPIIVYTVIAAKRRLNDLDQSGWLSLIILIPLVNFLFGLYLIIARGSEGNNSHGPVPSPNTAATILGALILPLVAIIGILAAVAIPAYQTYAQKSRAAAHAPAPVQAPQ